jgi:predicted membrane-bound spermidine synthase
LSQIDQVRDVLLISGGLGDSHRGLQHGAKRVDYVELDPSLTRMAEELGFIKKVPGLNVVNDDGRHYVKTASRRYDAVIVDLPTQILSRSTDFTLRSSSARSGIFLTGEEFSPSVLAIPQIT